MQVLGYDVGGTKIEAAVVSLRPLESASARAVQGYEAKVLSRVRRPTERAKGYDHIVSQMVAAGREALGEAELGAQTSPALTGAGAGSLAAIGIGLPGAVDPRSQTMVNGNTLALVGRPVARDVATALGMGHVSVAVGNDANCFALAEHYCGAGLEVARDMGLAPDRLSGVGIILGTGCGGGFVIDGQLVAGARGGAAEIGHTVLVRNGHSCYCGQRGCAEQYLSGTAIESHYAARRYAQVQNIVSAREIFEQAENGEPLAVAVIKTYVQDLGAFLAGLTNLLDPDYFVLGGGVSLQPAIYRGLEQRALADTFLPHERLRIESHRLGDSAGVVGAALLPIYRQRMPSL